MVTDLETATVFLSPQACSGGPEFELDYYGSNCLGEGTVFVDVYGDPEFVRAAVDGLRVESFSPPS